MSGEELAANKNKLNQQSYEPKAAGFIKDANKKGYTVSAEGDELIAKSNKVKGFPRNGARGARPTPGTPTATERVTSDIKKVGAGIKAVGQEIGSGVQRVGRAARDIVTGRNVINAIDKRQADEKEIDTQRRDSRNSDYRY